MLEEPTQSLRPIPLAEQQTSVVGRKEIAELMLMSPAYTQPPTPLHTHTPFTSINPSSSQCRHVAGAVIIPASYTRLRGSERLNHLPEVTQLASDAAGMPTRAAWL